MYVCIRKYKNIDPLSGERERDIETDRQRVRKPEGKVDRETE